MRKKVLVTGGLGYLGGRIAIQLLTEGYDVKISTTRQEKYSGNYNGCELIQISWDNLESLIYAVKDVDYIIHTSGANSNDCQIDPTLAFNVNAMSTAYLMKAVQYCQKVKKIIYFSTAHVYKSPLTGIIDETVCPLNLHPYATSHRAAEDIVLSCGTKDLITTVVLRLSNAFGAPINVENNCWMLLANDLCRQAITNKQLQIYANSNQTRDFIPIMQIVKGVKFILEQNFHSGVYNFGSGKSKSLVEMAELIQQRTNFLFGYTPKIILPMNFKYFDSNNSLIYKIEKLESLGFIMENFENLEIDNLLKFCNSSK